MSTGLISCNVDDLLAGRNERLDEARSRDAHVRLSMGHVFLETCMELKDDAVERLCKILAVAPIKAVSLLLVPLAEDASHRCRRLFQALGTNPAVTEASIAIATDAGTLAKSFLRSLPQLLCLEVDACREEGVPTENDVAEFARELAKLPNLTVFRCELPSFYHRILLPALHDIVTLTQVSLRTIFSIPDRQAFESTTAAEVLADLIRHSHNPLDLQLQFLCFGRPESQIVCDAIAESAMKSLHIAHCTVDAVALARSVAASRLQDFTLVDWLDKDAGGNHDYTSFSQFIGAISVAMPHLQKLDLSGLFFNSFEALPGRGIGTLVRGLVACPRLRSVRFPRVIRGTLADKALADFIGVAGSQVEEIHWSSSRVDGSILLDALATNYTIRRIVCSLGADQDSVDKVDMITRLNCAGRAYVTKDPQSVEAGFQVLEKVNDDLNCLFYHLCENPVVCKRYSDEASTVGASRKRSAPGGLIARASGE